MAINRNYIAINRTMKQWGSKVNLDKGFMGIQCTILAIFSVSLKLLLKKKFKKLPFC